MPKPIKRKLKSKQDNNDNEHAILSSIGDKIAKTTGINVNEDEDSNTATPELTESLESTEAIEKNKDQLKKALHKSKDSKELKKKLYQSRRVVFVLGAVLGLLLTIFLSTFSSQDLRNELEQIVRFDSSAFFLDDWKDLLPAGIQSMLSDFENKDSNKPDELNGSAESFSAGKRMVEQYNLTAKHNVIMVPGVISTGIESWGLNEDGDCPSIHHFRKRLWGSFYMLRTMILDKTCWLKHIMLDPETGLDPPNIKLRASQGFESSDFFVAGYWIWNKIIQNLAVIGYGPNNMLSASYDWRLAYLDLEIRDGYFTKLKTQIETIYKLSGEKSILIGHSMGSQVIFYFMKWVEANGDLYGNGGPNWCNTYLDSIIDISGSILGTPKTIPVLLSGEMKDTVQMNQLAIYGLEKFFSRKERVDLVRTFGGVPAMLPKGGDVIWGNLTHAPDDPSNTLITNSTDVEIEGTKKESVGNFIRYISKKNLSASRNFTIATSIDYILDFSPDWFSNRVRSQYSYGIAKTKNELSKNNQDHLKWSNPLEASLPIAPNMRIYSFYGVGNPTERAYNYGDDFTALLPMTIDLENENPIYMADGDGTVSLLTHTMSHEWKKPKSRFNPANINVTIVEIKHEPDRYDIRGGAKTAEHVDILGSSELNELILRVAGGQGDKISDRYVSDLHQIVDRMAI